MAAAVVAPAAAAAVEGVSGSDIAYALTAVSLACIGSALRTAIDAHSPGIGSAPSPPLDLLRLAHKHCSIQSIVSCAKMAAALASSQTAAASQQASPIPSALKGSKPWRQQCT